MVDILDRANGRRRSMHPAIHTAGRPRLRVLGTEITLLEPIRRQIEQDLGVDIEFEVLDFLSAQRKAATEPDSFDIYDQCFHNLDIVWFWRAVQPIDLARIPLWNAVSELTKSGRIDPSASPGRGDAPVNKLYVQPGLSLGSKPSDRISMLPTVYNLDSFAYVGGLFADRRSEDASWAWLFDKEAKGQLALVDEPAIGVFDAALAFEARGEIAFGDIGNMTAAEIDALMALLTARKREGFFAGTWKTARESADTMISGGASVASMWSPGVIAVMRAGVEIQEAVPREGYRAWHGGICLSARLAGRALDAAYDYLNWWLGGAPAEAVQIAIARMGADADAVRDREAHRAVHQIGIAGMESRGHIGRTDERHEIGVVGVAEPPVAQPLAEIAVDVDRSRHDGSPRRLMAVNWDQRRTR